MLLAEAIAQSERPLSRSSIRTLALEPGGPGTLSSYPRLDVETKAALVDVIDPPSLARALSSVRGQTVLVTGRVDDNLLYFRPSSGAEQSVKLTELARAASDNDVNLVILHAEAPRQPGGRNWFWQRIAVGGLDDALKRATFGDFLDALGAVRGDFRVSVRRGPAAASPSAPSRPTATRTDRRRRRRLVDECRLQCHRQRSDERRGSARLRRGTPEGARPPAHPHIPSWYQFAYLAGLIAGVLGWPVASAWYARVWPPEERAEFRTASVIAPRRPCACSPICWCFCRSRACGPHRIFRTATVGVGDAARAGGALAFRPGTRRGSRH